MAKNAAFLTIRGRKNVGREPKDRGVGGTPTHTPGRVGPYMGTPCSQRAISGRWCMG